MTEFQDPKLPVPQRIKAMDAAWAASTGTSHDETRDALKAVAWSRQSPTPLRLAALEKLVNDPASEADARQSARLMIPLEPSLQVVALLGDAAVAHGWTELTPALVRSYARPGNGPDSTRPERRALLVLNPNKSIVEIVFEVFLHPSTDPTTTDPGAPGIDYAKKARSAAWELLGRLDPEGTQRAPLIAAQSGSPEGPDRVLEDLRLCQNDFHTVPITGEELAWLESLRDPAIPSNAAWWAEAASAISKLTPDQLRGLRLRHIEPIRWAGANRLDWLAAGRETLLGELAARLKDTTIHRRTVRADLSNKPPSERLAEIRDQLVWADALSILVLDDAIHDPTVTHQVFTQVAEDRTDGTTEYGGLLFLPPRGYQAASYPPRPTERLGDIQFVASPDMIAQGDLAVAHYHFHVAKVFNSEFSGPSGGDLAYAARFGRNCIVFTSITREALSADYYQPDGVVLDLGEVRAR